MTARELSDSGGVEASAAFPLGTQYPPDLARWSAYLLGRAAQRARERQEAALEGLGLRWRSYGVLVLIHTYGPLSQQEMVERSSIDRTTMVALIDELERLGLAERHRNVQDRRANAVHLTARGTALLERATERVAATEDRLLDEFAPAERALFRAFLERFVQHGIDDD